jgi:hypothetical protein
MAASMSIGTYKLYDQIAMADHITALLLLSARWRCSYPAAVVLYIVLL